MASTSDTSMQMSKSSTSGNQRPGSLGPPVDLVLVSGFAAGSLTNLFARAPSFRGYVLLYALRELLAGRLWQEGCGWGWKPCAESLGEGNLRRLLIVGTRLPVPPRLLPLARALHGARRQLARYRKELCLTARCQP